MVSISKKIYHLRTLMDGLKFRAETPVDCGVPARLHVLLIICLFLKICKLIRELQRKRGSGTLLTLVGDFRAHKREESEENARSVPY
jgi:hypothetical protein